MSIEVKGSGRTRIVRPASLVEQVYQQLHNDIVSRRIAPNARLLVDHLVADLGVSQTPIREALSMLEANGLVSKQQNIGYSTTRLLSRAEYEQLFETRLLLEPFVAQRAAERARKAELAELARLTTAGGAFHAKVAEIAGNEFTRTALLRLHSHFHLARLDSERRLVPAATVEHEAVYDAIAAGDAMAAEAAMRGHLENSFERLMPLTDD